MLQNLLSIKLNCKKEELVFALNKNGRPFLKNTRWNGDFNISHSGDWIICALAAIGKVGIDVEEIKPIDLRIAVKVLTHEEYLSMIELDSCSQLSFFYNIWTLKESFIKVTGQGLILEPASFGFNMKEWEENKIILKKDICRNWIFKQYSLSENYSIAVCSNNKRLPDKIETLPIHKILD